MKAMKTMQSKKQMMSDVLLIFVFTVLSVSGINLHLTAKNGMDRLVWGLGHDTWQTLHIVSAILTMIFISVHIYQHRNWYKSLFKSSKAKRKRNKGTIILTAIFTLVILTGLIDWIGNVPNSTLGLIHAKLGQVMVLFVIVHIYNRLPNKAGFRKNKELKVIATKDQLNS